MLIAIDHGNKLIKTVHCAPFTSGLEESDTAPFGGETLRYLLPRFRRGGGAVRRFPPRRPGAERRRRVPGGGELSPLGDDLLGGANGKPMNGIWQINGIISAKSSRTAAFCYQYVTVKQYTGHLLWSMFWNVLKLSKKGFTNRLEYDILSAN